MIKKYRNSLEEFIYKQVIGPGIFNNRIVNTAIEAINKISYSEINPLYNYEEIVDSLPSGLYSSGIIFPIDNSKKITDFNTTQKEIVKEVDSKIEDGQNEYEYNEDDPNESEDIESDVVNDINQVYPNQMGFSCAIDEQEFLKSKSLELNIAARYYTKVAKAEKKDLGILLPEDVNLEHFRNFLQSNNLSSSILLKCNNFNNYILLNKEITLVDIAEKKKFLRESVEKEVALIIANRFKELYKEDSIIGNVNFSNLKITIFRILKDKEIDESKRKVLFDLSQELELTESYISYINQLIDLYINSYGIWKSNFINLCVKISNVEFPKGLRKKSFLYKGDNGLDVKVFSDDKQIGDNLFNIFSSEIEKDEKASLSLNFQLTRNTKINDGKIYLKFQLLNTSTPFTEKAGKYYSIYTEQVSQKSFFGVALSFKDSALVEYTNKTYPPNSENVYDEDTTTKFTYNAFKNYGVGHGCSVKWNPESKTISTEFLPTCETPDVDPEPKNKYKFVKTENGEFIPEKLLKASKYQSFKWLSNLSDATDEDVIEGLMNFVQAYGDWIKNKREHFKSVKELDLVRQELDKCDKDYQRMLNNINELLAGDINNLNLKIFRLMNTAMLMQLWHSSKAKKHKKFIEFLDGVKEDFSYGEELFSFEFYQTVNDHLFGDEPASWRAFQLAFILLNLDGIFQSPNDPNWSSRNDLVDLVWFPTGGGKTEAYLGLIALTIINRRLIHKENGGGTAAFMRYTLRLLTTQQFQRASLLIMAIELIRRWKLKGLHLGDEPISIGLWVGKNSMPNKNEDLIKLVRTLNEENNKSLPFSNCPWCNSKLEGEELVSKNSNVFEKGRVVFYCSNEICSFNTSIGSYNKYAGPIYLSLSDEMIYQHPPTLLFGTVDKFAQLAHKVSNEKDKINADSRRIFGNGNWEKDRKLSGNYLPPDLIIQDELHLLVGPLGSATGLFETAIDVLTTREDGTRAKVISSTATTRNTQSQIAALFGRDVSIFPKPGVEADDSFFAFYKRKKDEEGNEQYNSKRKYVGILPTGRTQVWMQFRIAALALVHRAIFETKNGPDKIINFEEFDASYIDAINYYFSVISYFNSLKEVGKTQAQVQTYLLKEVRKLFHANIYPKNLLECFYAFESLKESELTGRLSGEQVVSELERVKKDWDPKTRFASGNNTEKLLRGSTPPEYIVATNMISVGLDVGRFNTIIMNSMPRNTAEYIQASSRVGRNKEGIVFTVHHPYKSRDISHFEKFEEFHQKMYSYVEPISITPYTKKALRKYLGLYLATMLRHQFDFPNRKDAKNISDVDLENLLESLLAPFLARKENLKLINPKLSQLLNESNLEDIKSILFEAIEFWKGQVSKNRADNKETVFNNAVNNKGANQENLFVDIDEYDGNYENDIWRIPGSLRIVEPEAVIKISTN